MMILTCLLALIPGADPIAAPSAETCLGETEHVYSLPRHAGEIRGVAFDADSPRAPRLFVLFDSGTVDVYRPLEEELEPLARIELSPLLDPAPFASPRGLSFAHEKSGDVLYTLNRAGAHGRGPSQLIRFRLDDRHAKVVDLSLQPYRIGNREVFGVARDGAELLVSFDAAGYRDRNLRVQRGILRLAWDSAGDEPPRFVRHLPDGGEAPARGLAVMELDGARYLWGSAGSDHLYVADSPTGRGLFFLDRPRTDGRSSPLGGLTFGHGDLWVPEGGSGPARIHRVNVTDNPTRPLAGPKILRHLTMSIRTEPEQSADDDAGRVYHYYSRPYDEAQMGRQGVWPETERVANLTEEEPAEIGAFTHDPAGDASSRQHMQSVAYEPTPPRACSSHYEIDLWIRDWRKCVYPHLVDVDRQARAGTDWLADDPDLYGLSDRATYTSFFERVNAHVEKKYGVEADLENPYWAARNAVEYIQDHYYYPSPPKGAPATVDYERNHYDGNPGHAKIALSARPYDGSQIIACSGTSVMIAGAMRHLGIPARWLGTGAQQGAREWDANGNDLLDRDETAPCTNGHRYNQVWLGDRYGWVCFDATPTKPALDDFDPPPPRQSQWRYMQRAAGGHRNPHRIVFNVGSELFRPLYREFEYDERRAVNNDCGGDQRYNLQGRFDRPEMWKNARHRIAVTNLCFIPEVTLSGPPAETRVSWTLEGSWERDPDARLSLFLVPIDGKGGKERELGPIGGPIPARAGSTVIDLSTQAAGSFRLALRKEGDPQTGGISEPFDL